MQLANSSLTAGRVEALLCHTIPVKLIIKIRRDRERFH